MVESQEEACPALQRKVSDSRVGRFFAVARLLRLTYPLVSLHLIIE